MKKRNILDTSPSFMLFIMSVFLGFLGLFMPWSSAYFRTQLVDVSMPQLMGHPLTFWQTSFFSLAFKQAPCRSWIVTQANTVQGSILNSVQLTGFLALFFLVFLWFAFAWINRKILSEAQRKQLLQTSLILVFIGTLLIVRMATFAECSLIQSIELLDVHFFIVPLFFTAFSFLFGGIALSRSRAILKEMESN